MEKPKEIVKKEGATEAKREALKRAAKKVVQFGTAAVILLSPQVGEKTTEKKEILQQVPKKEITVNLEEETMREKISKLKEEVIQGIALEKAKTVKKDAKLISIKELERETKPESQEKYPEISKEPKEKIQESIKLTPAELTKEFKDILRAELEGKKTYLKDLNVLEKVDSLAVNIELGVKILIKNFDITLNFDLVNKGDSLGLENIEVNTSFMIKGIVKAEINSYLSRLIPILKENLESKYKEQIDTIQIDEAGNLEINFK